MSEPLVSLILRESRVDSNLRHSSRLIWLPRVKGGPDHLLL